MKQIIFTFDYNKNLTDYSIKLSSNIMYCTFAPTSPFMSTEKNFKLPKAWYTIEQDEGEKKLNQLCVEHHLTSPWERNCQTATMNLVCPFPYMELHSQATNSIIIPIRWRLFLCDKDLPRKHNPLWSHSREFLFSWFWGVSMSTADRRVMKKKTIGSFTSCTRELLNAVCKHWGIKCGINPSCGVRDKQHTVLGMNRSEMEVA